METVAKKPSVLFLICQPDIEDIKPHSHRSPVQMTSRWVKQERNPEEEKNLIVISNVGISCLILSAFSVLISYTFCV